MSIFAGLAQGFAQGAMAAMPAATDRYVQARRRAKEREQLVQDRAEQRAYNDLRRAEDREYQAKQQATALGINLGDGEFTLGEINKMVSDQQYVQRTRQEEEEEIRRKAAANQLALSEQALNPRMGEANKLVQSGVPYNMIFDQEGNVKDDGIGQGRDFLAQKKRKEKQNEINFGYSYEERQAQIESMRRRLEILQGESNNQLALDALSVYERNPTKASFDAAFKSYEDWAKASYKPPMSSSSQPAGNEKDRVFTEKESNRRQFYQPSNLTVAMQRIEDAENRPEEVRQAIQRSIPQVGNMATWGVGVGADTQGTIPLGDSRNARPNLMTSMEDSSSVTPSFSTGNTSGSTSIDSLGGGDDLSRLDNDTIINRALADDEAAIQEAERRGLFQ